MILWFTPHREYSKVHVQGTLSPICQMFHTGQTADMRGPVLILISHFTAKVQFITFLTSGFKFRR